MQKLLTIWMLKIKAVQNDECCCLIPFNIMEKRGDCLPKMRPNFMKNPYFVDEPGNWHLKKGASNELKAELEDYLYSQEELDELDDPGSINGNKIEYPYNR